MYTRVLTCVTIYGADWLKVMVWPICDGSGTIKVVRKREVVREELTARKIESAVN